MELCKDLWDSNSLLREREKTVEPVEVEDLVQSPANPYCHEFSII